MHKRPILSLALVVLCFLLSTGSAMSAGFALYEWSARGVAMGGTGVALADDPSAVASNPAGITQLEGTQTLVGITGISPSAKAEVTRDGSTTTTETAEFTGMPPHAYLTHQLGDHYWLGMGLYTRFGLATEWDEDWAGRYSAYYAGVKSYSLTPTLGIKVTDSLSVAVGVEAMMFEFAQKKKADGTALGLGEVDVDLLGESIGTGWNAAIHYRPFEWLSAGFVYRSQVTQNLHGQAKYDKHADVGPFRFFDNCDIEGTVTLPDSYTFGLAVKPLKNLAIEGSAIYTGWRSYEDLTIHFSDAPNPTVPATATQRFKKDYHDTWRYQLGVEYKPTDFLALRAGYIYDEEPINEDWLDYMLPANDRQLYSLGLGYKKGPFSVDTAYCYLNAKQRNGVVKASSDPDDTEHDITFKDNHAHIVSLSFGYAF